MNIIKLNIVFIIMVFIHQPLHAEIDKPSSVNINLTNSTQGPLWPPSEAMDENGDFVLIGNILKEVQPGMIGMEWGAAIISKDTVPPLDINGVEDFTNPFGAPYQVIRELNLEKGSPDLEIELYSLSFGPYEGNFGGGPRIPKINQSIYNLNGAEPSCPELFPSSEVQAQTYTKDSYPISQVPIPGFQGDHIQLNPETGMEEDPNYSSGPDCGAGCSGENNVDDRNEKPYLLGDHLSAKGQLMIKLKEWDDQLNAFQSANFIAKFHNLKPNGVYSLWAIRPVVIQPSPLIRRPDPLSIPNVYIADSKGNLKIDVDVKHPFPAIDAEDGNLRIIGLAVDLHSDETIWGACPDRIGPGITIHNVFNDVFLGTPVDEFVTLSNER